MMRPRKRSRAAPEVSLPRGRPRKNGAVACDAACEEEELISGLDELLRADQASAWWEEGDPQPAEASLADLLQELAACDDEGDAIFQLSDTDSAPSAAITTKMDDVTSDAAAGGARPLPAATRRPSNNRDSNKNAMAARLNRLRKKEYVTGLEEQVARLTQDNQRLERDRRELRERARRLEEEARYLRAVLANDSALSQLLGRLTGLGGLKLSTSLFSERAERRRPEEEEHDYAMPVVLPEEEPQAPPAGGGVCLHVDKDRLSVEFCTACARSAAAAAKIFFFR
ncbi:CREB/ATF bZIP transcription factor [Hyperolius riggenbachi]|uniref:CREB/ATF bZIP transcription factor n=1 Tax=Hyperolius riggenbachi TaxID=752182 RepID=UPI0035A2F937